MYRPSHPTSVLMIIVNKLYIKMVGNQMPPGTWEMDSTGSCSCPLEIVEISGFITTALDSYESRS